jgi:hypothetical protein
MRVPRRLSLTTMTAATLAAGLLVAVPATATATPPAGSSTPVAAAPAS